MIQSFVTQCPHCRTSFRVSLTQLNAAHGAVRCGACLHVFNAAQQLRQQGQQLPPTPSPASSQAARTTPAAMPAANPAPAVAPAEPTAAAKMAAAKANETQWIHDDLDLDNLDLDEELAKLDAQEQLRSQQPAPLTPAISPSLSTAAPIKADAVAPAQTATPAPPANNAEAAHAPQEQSSTTPETRTELSFSALDEQEPDAEREPPLSAPPLDETDSTPTAKTAQPSADDNETELRSSADTERHGEPKLGNDYRLELHDDPLQLDWQPPKSPWPRRLGWLSLNLLAALVLAGQYLWYHFDELARQDQYRPWFEQLCPTLGCTLPSKVDISQIKSSNLVVRSHPEFSGALVVDAILYNRASFSQPFPLLEMRFADINGQLLASRRFKPSEYLAGELAGNSEMPPQTPIHISLDILDPGTQAVNYSLSFHSP